MPFSFTIYCESKGKETLHSHFSHNYDFELQTYLKNEAVL